MISTEKPCRVIAAADLSRASISDVLLYGLTLDDDNPAPLARNIRRSRRRTGLTQKQLTERAKMHWRRAQKVEKGEVNGTLQTITRIAGPLKVDPSKLLRTRAKTKAPMKRRTR